MDAVIAPRPVTPVGILADRLRRLSDRFATDTVTDSDTDVRSEIAALADLAGGLDPYLQACTSPESDGLAALAARTAGTDWVGRSGVVAVEQEMLSGHVEGQFLRLLVHAVRARRVLEIGTFTGYATLAMAEALPADGEVVTCELDPEVAAFAEESFAAAGAGDRITVHVGPALDALAELSEDGAGFDLIFLDADKSGYTDYLAAVLDGDLLAPHGLLCVDNTLLQGEPWSAEPGGNGRAVAEFNRALAADDRVEQVLVPLRDGITLVRLAGTR